MTAPSVVLALVLLALVLTIAHAANGRVPIWIAVLVLTLAMLLR